LDGGKTYYWKVTAVNDCGEISANSSFDVMSCKQFSQPTAMAIANSTTQESTISVADIGPITDVNLVNMKGTHAYVYDLTVNLKSPTGTSVELFKKPCGANSKFENFDLGFDDDASSATLPCPFTTSGYFKPSGSLASFNSEEMQGDWKLSIEDDYTQDAGNLESWTLEICFTPTITAIAVPLEVGFAIYPNPTSDKITVLGKGIKQVSVLNLLGQMVNTYSVNGDELEINLENQPSGVYFIQIMSGEKQTVKQIIKE
jgi:subtilisin-like proprotein convertase family protein